VYRMERGYFSTPAILLNCLCPPLLPGGENAGLVLLGEHDVPYESGDQ